MTWLVTATIALLSCPLLPVLRGDTVVMNDRRRFEGVIVEEDADSVTIEMVRAGAMMRARLPRDGIQTVEYVDRVGPPYCVLPILGSIGMDVTAEQFVTAAALREGLEEARSAKVEFVVLLIDSRGGSITETEAIIDAIAAADDLRFVAYVREAISAAAVIAMACPDIYMAPQGIIGAAVPYQQTPNGTPKSIEEKMQSAVRAGCRAAAELGGHSRLLMRGMMEPDLELTLVAGPDGPLVVDSQPDQFGTIIKRKGQILTLTAGESLEYGLASGIADSVQVIGTQLGLPAWHRTDDRPWHRIVHTARVQREQEVARHQQKQLMAARKAYMDDIQPELARIRARLALLRARKKSLSQGKAAFKRQNDAERKAVETAFRRAKKEAESSDNPFYFTSRATSVYTIQIAAVKRQWTTESTRIQEALSEATFEEQELTTRNHEVLSEIPEAK